MTTDHRVGGRSDRPSLHSAETAPPPTHTHTELNLASSTQSTQGREGRRDGGKAVGMERDFWWQFQIGRAAPLAPEGNTLDLAAGTVIFPPFMF